MQRYRNGRIVIQEGDITKCAVDALLSPANPSLSPTPQGLDGQIARAAGPELDAALRELGGCEPGQAKATPGFDLAAKIIVHAVSPTWQGGHRDEDQLLEACYESALRVALEHDARSIAIPPLGLRFPKDRAAQIAIASVLDFQEQHPSIDLVIFCCATAADLAVYELAAHEYL